MQPDIDTIILGGGCAGLSLGLRLATQGRAQRALILESRTGYANDRTWCFWRSAPHRFEHLVRKSWNQMTVGTRDRTISIDCARTPYQMIEALPFYDHSSAAIARSPRVELALGVDVLGEPIQVAGGWRVETTQGVLTSQWVVDTRPPRARHVGAAMLWQSFFGQEVMFDRPVFDPAVAGLMDFATDRTNTVLFHYVLPLTPDRALIETTVFGPRPIQPPDLAVDQAAAVAKLGGGATGVILRSEHGVLPMGMTAQFPSLGPGHCRAGLMTGAARASTGYAFQRIQRWADIAAQSIVNGRAPMGHGTDPALRRAMDRLFLRVVRGHPDRAPDLFMRMFGNTDPARVIRFLSDQGSLADCAILGATLPIPLFLGEMVKSLFAAPLSASQAT
jgi:lycopene beta-cyclase